jgi:excinuclease ABC subunit A
MAEYIVVKNARQHNLKGIDLEIPRDKLVVITGLSGSGKSSLAFDTLYAEGQRRYVESLSAYARQFLEQMDKPDVDSIEGLSPAISIEQKTASKNPRSTVATITEIHDYLRILYARVGEPFCPDCDLPISAQSPQEIVDQLLSRPEKTRLTLLAPLIEGRKGTHKEVFDRLSRDGFVRARVNGLIVDLAEDVSLDKKKKHTIEAVVDRLVVSDKIGRRLTDSVELALRLAEGTIRVVIQEPDREPEEILFSEVLGCPNCGFSLPELTPQMFSFNNPQGACPACDGLGTRLFLDPDLIVPDKDKSLMHGAIEPWSKRQSEFFLQTLEALARHYRFDLFHPWHKLPAKVRHAVLYGSGDEAIRFVYEGEGHFHNRVRPFEGVIPNLMRRYHDTGSPVIREEIERFMSLVPCEECGGARLRKTSLAVKVGGLNLAQVAAFTIRRADAFFEGLKFDKRRTEIARRVLKEIRERISFLMDVGLDYLTLDRSSATLSGGEGQRIRLATQIGSRLVGVLYILDEPSIGLHQRDNRRLLATLVSLRDLGNTVLVVEHDAETILTADHVIDMGPGAGRMGGQVVFNGTPAQLKKDQKSLTGAYLSGRKAIPVPAQRRRPGNGHLIIEGAVQNNLQDLTVKFPLGVLTVVTGVSGSGKSSLVIDTLQKALAQHLYRAKDRPGQYKKIRGLGKIDKVVDIDQTPIGRTPRSNPATYTGLFTPIRDLFSQTPESRMRGYKPGRFSFNVRGGRCPDCEGDGIIRIEMHFLPDVYVKCETCGGKRYNRDTLEIKYKGATIADVLDMTVNQAGEFFGAVPVLRRKLQTLIDVGLGYVKLGQSATTLSGGEAQRIKLSRELSKRDTGRTLYVLDEPTTGLHFDDINRLLSVLDRLVTAGNTVVVIEHNLDVVKCADHIIDLGPEGGDGGGRIVAEGTPEEVARVKTSHTGRYLAAVLGGRS